MRNNQRTPWAKYFAFLLAPGLGLFFAAGLLMAYIDHFDPKFGQRPVDKSSVTSRVVSTIRGWRTPKPAKQARDAKAVSDEPRFAVPDAEDSELERPQMVLPPWKYWTIDCPASPVLTILVDASPTTTRVRWEKTRLSVSVEATDGPNSGRVFGYMTVPTLSPRGNSLHGVCTPGDRFRYSGRMQVPERILVVRDGKRVELGSVFITRLESMYERDRNEPQRADTSLAGEWTLLKLATDLQIPPTARTSSDGETVELVFHRTGRTKNAEAIVRFDRNSSRWVVVS